ncbi:MULTISPECIES: hypothetical protein [unclassified Streptomyces]|uniref:hypothetical protein n=1 Tax=unclassified Streptomyces TaxID=2593676 RepID=UPI00364774F6
MASILLAACSQGSESADMEVRDEEAVKTQVEQASSRILEIMALNGKVTDTGAMTIRCSDYESDENVYRARHPWSVYQVPVSDMEKAMDRLRDGLPEKGWKIVKDGVDDSPAKSPQIVAESKGQEYAVDVRLLDERKYGDDPSLLEVTVQSACYRAK